MVEVLSAVLLISVGANVILSWHLWKAKKLPPRPETYEVQELMTDLLRGQALVRVERVAPADVFLRSPRGRS